jgi:hypothetical protein
LPAYPGVLSTKATTFFRGQQYRRKQYPAIRNRSKKLLFSGTLEGAEVSALLYSVIETGRMYNLDPYAYLRYIFREVADRHFS